MPEVGSIKKSFRKGTTKSSDGPPGIGAINPNLPDVFGPRLDSIVPLRNNFLIGPRREVIILIEEVGGGRKLNGDPRGGVAWLGGRPAARPENKGYLSIVGGGGRPGRFIF